MASINSSYKFSLIDRSIAEQLKSGVHGAPEIFDGTTIMFSAISDFVSLTTISTPIQTVTLLNDLYITIDNVIPKFDVYKVIFLTR